MKPDYSRSLLALISSILTHYGAETPHATLPEMDALLANGYKNVVVMLFDGMGSALLEKHLPESSFFRRHKICDIASVFPATTTAATVTLESGLSPIQHGWLGWNLYFPEAGGNVAIFPNTLSGEKGGQAAPYHLAKKHLAYETVFEKIERALGGRVKAAAVSPFSPYASKSTAEICRTVETLCAETGKHYIYTYWHQPDYNIHDFGTGHEIVLYVNTL